jgi:hypothetical protein
MRYVRHFLLRGPFLDFPRRARRLLPLLRPLRHPLDRMVARPRLQLGPRRLTRRFFHQRVPEQCLARFPAPHAPSFPLLLVTSPLPPKDLN